ncbi:MAG: DUF971 domain-containing protein [bacterium]|nr:DUF971 domain-containing protein [Planctomycetota bacterium]HIL52525.1 DUF971 domain-containing protein [Planctomycetota bacterium]
MTSFQPKTITQSNPKRVTILWGDGETSEYTAAGLRRLCPCAQCVSESTGVRLLDPTTVAEDLTQGDLALVGNYALTMRFSDGHSTGIFTFKALRKGL